MKYSVVLLCAGKGERCGLGYNKILYKINGKELYKYSLDIFLNDSDCERIILVSSGEDYDTFKLLENDRILVTKGGLTRGDSVRNGLNLIDSKIVLIHDSARPLLDKDDIDKLIEKTIENGAAVLCNPCFNTIAKKNSSKIESYANRDEYVMVATPQAFMTDRIKDAYFKSFSDGLSFTDDTSIYKRYYGDCEIVLTNTLSIKATTLNDLRLLERILK